MTDIVNSPPHYTTGKIEVIDYIEDKGLGFHLGNAVKYISRAGHKDPSKYVEDLKKAIWYVEREISRCQEKGVKERHLREAASINYGDDLLERINAKIQSYVKENNNV